MDEETMRSYQVALRTGKGMVPHMRTFICGSGRVGKTSLVNSLLDLPYDKQADSTIGVKLEKAACSLEQVDSSWVWRREESEESQHERLAAKMLVEEIKRKAQGQPEHNAEAPVAMEDRSTHEPVFHAEQCDHSASEGTCYDGTLPEQDCFPEEEDHPQVPEKNNSCREPIPARDDSDHETVTGATPSPSVNDASFHTDPLNQGAPTTSARTEEILRDYKLRATEIARQFLEKYRHKQDFLEAMAQKDMCFVDLWDFAGQLSFAAFQHMLLAELRCAFCPVFNASLPLDERATQTINLAGEEHPIDQGLHVTHFDILERWLNIIHQVIGDSDAFVCIVGTFLDKIPLHQREKRKEEIEDYIWKRAKGKCYENNIHSIVFVDNTVSGTQQPDGTVLWLKEIIVEATRPKLQLPIPLCWMPFTVAMRDLAKTQDLPWITVQQASDLAHVVCRTSSGPGELDVHAMLKFHHHLGHALHYDQIPGLTDIVIINVAWLLKVVSLLFMPLPKKLQHPRFRRYYDLLYDRGILLEDLAEHIWQTSGDSSCKAYTETAEQRDIVFKVMEEFALLCDAHQLMSVVDGAPESRMFFIPALVSAVSDDEDHAMPDVEGKTTEQSEPMILFCGQQSTFPQSVFWCLAVSCLHRFKPGRDSNRQPILRRDSVSIVCGLCCWLSLRHFQHGIELVVERDTSGETSHIGSESYNLPTVHDVCPPILGFIEDRLGNMKHGCLKHMRWDRAIRCDCRQRKAKCRKKDDVWCKHLDCGHYTALIENTNASCSINPRYLINVRAVLEHWLPSLLPRLVRYVVFVSQVRTAQAMPA